MKSNRDIWTWWTIKTRFHMKIWTAIKDLCQKCKSATLINPNLFYLEAQTLLEREGIQLTQKFVVLLSNKSVLLIQMVLPLMHLLNHMLRSRRLLVQQLLWEWSLSIRKVTVIQKAVWWQVVLTICARCQWLTSRPSSYLCSRNQVSCNSRDNLHLGESFRALIFGLCVSNRLS